MFIFLFEQVRIVAHSFGPMGEGVDYTKLGREAVVAIPLKVLVCMSGFPVHSNGYTSINHWFYDGVQEGDGTILIVVFHCKFNSRVNTVNVLKEVLFVDFLVDDKGVIYKSAPKPGGGGQCLELFALSTPCKGWLLWGLLGNPWLHPQTVQRTGLGRRNMCF